MKNSWPGSRTTGEDMDKVCHPSQVKWESMKVFTQGKDMAQLLSYEKSFHCGMPTWMPSVEARGSHQNAQWRTIGAGGLKCQWK